MLTAFKLSESIEDLLLYSMSNNLTSFKDKIRRYSVHKEFPEKFKEMIRVREIQFVKQEDFKRSIEITEDDKVMEDFFGTKGERFYKRELPQTTITMNDYLAGKR